MDWDKLPDDAFVFIFPMHTYLIGSGPDPGRLRDRQRGIEFVPLWTDSDLFATYLEQSGHADQVTHRQFDGRSELIAFLESVRNLVGHVIVDPNRKMRPVATAWKIGDMIAQLSRNDRGEIGRARD
jgi:hypothetical protein